MAFDVLSVKYKMKINKQMYRSHGERGTKMIKGIVYTSSVFAPTVQQYDRLYLYLSLKLSPNST